MLIYVNAHSCLVYPSSFRFFTKIFFLNKNLKYDRKLCEYPRIPFAPLVVLLLFPFVPVVLHLYLIVNENMSSTLFFHLYYFNTYLISGKLVMIPWVDSVLLFNDQLILPHVHVFNFRCILFWINLLTCIFNSWDYSYSNIY